ncbi:hypothetical protein JCM6882_004488 [Rhodosporidiobolus microsporus]
MAGRSRDGAEPTVGVFWDYENIRFPSNTAPHSALSTLRELALSKGDVQLWRVYMETDLERTIRTEALRAHIVQAGWTLADAPHAGRKDVVDKMIMVDMTVFALKAKTPPVIILITGDQDYWYACSTLRNHRCRIVLVTTSSATMSLRQAADEVLDWRMDILKLSPGLPPPAKKKKRHDFAERFYQQLPPPPPQPYAKPLHPALSTHSYALQQQSQARRMLPAFVGSRFDHSAPPAYSSLLASTSSSSSFQHQPAPLPTLDLTGPSNYQLLSAAPEATLRAEALQSAINRRKGKARAVEVLTLSDDEVDGGGSDDSDIEIEVPRLLARTPSAQSRHARGRSDPLSASRPRPSPRRATYGNPAPDLDAARPPSTMEESAHGSSPPRGKIEVLYSLEHPNASSSSSTSTPAGTSKKRRWAADLLQLSDPPVPSPAQSPGKSRRKRPRAASVPVEDSDDERDEAAGEAGVIDVDPDSSAEMVFNPATPFSARSTASSHYDLLLTHPSPSDGEQSPLFVRQGGKRRTGTPLARKVAAKAAAGRSKLAEEVRDEEESDSDDDSVVVLSD